jgi:hypothetical protein
MAHTCGGENPHQVALAHGHTDFARRLEVVAFAGEVRTLDTTLLLNGAINKAGGCCSPGFSYDFIQNPPTAREIRDQAPHASIRRERDSLRRRAAHRPLSPRRLCRSRRCRNLPPPRGVAPPPVTASSSAQTVGRARRGRKGRARVGATSWSDHQSPPPRQPQKPRICETRARTVGHGLGRLPCPHEVMGCAVFLLVLG